MNILYLDTLFFVNFLIDYLTLLCAAKCSGAIIRRFPIAIASVCGGLYACLTCFPSLSVLTHPGIKLACGGLLCLISYGKERNFYRCCLCFLCISAVFGGVLSAFSLSVNGIIYLPISGKYTILTFSAVYFLLSLFYRRQPQSALQKTHEIIIHFQNRTVAFTALQDTGNTLYDPITNTPVLVCSHEILLELLPEAAEGAQDAYSLFFELNQQLDIGNQLKLVPFQTVGGRGILLAIRPDSVIIDGTPEEITVAFSPDSFSRHNTYQAIY